jgi:integrase
VRDHLIISLALGTGLRLGELVGLNVADVYASDGTPKTRIRVRPEIAKRGRAGDVFLPDKLVTKLRRLWQEFQRTSSSVVVSCSEHWS